MNCDVWNSQIWTINMDIGLGINRIGDLLKIWLCILKKKISKTLLGNSWQLQYGMSKANEKIKQITGL